MKQIDPGVRAGAPDKIEGLEMMQKALVWISVARMTNMVGMTLVAMSYHRLSPIHYLVVHILITAVPVICSIAQVNSFMLLIRCFTRISLEQVTV